VLNDNDNDNDNEESKSTQSKGTSSKASDGYNDVSTIGDLDAAPPCDPTWALIGDGLDLATQLLLSNLTAASNCNDGNNGAANEESFLPIVGSIDESNVPPSRDPTSELMADGFPLASQLLLFNPTNGVINDECLPLTKRQRSTSSCGDPTLDVIATDER
jgi:hypothetical protein